MAKLRSQLWLERTTLAWIRTALTMATFDFALVAFFRTLSERSPTAEYVHLHQSVIMFGTALVILGAVATVLGGNGALAYATQIAPRHRGVCAWPVFEHPRSNALGRGQLGVALAPTRTLSRVRSSRVAVEALARGHGGAR